MLKLVVLTEETVAEGALEHTSTMVPHTPVTLDTDGVSKWTCAGVCGETLTAMTYPRLTEVTYSTLQVEGVREGREEGSSSALHTIAVALVDFLANDSSI